MSRSYIVATDEGCLYISIRLAVEENDGYSFLIGALDGGGYLGIFIGCHHQQVDTRVRKAVYLPYLKLGIIVAVYYTYVNVFIEQILCSQHFIVQFVAPVPF